MSEIATDVHPFLHSPACRRRRQAGEWRIIGAIAISLTRLVHQPREAVGVEVRQSNQAAVKKQIRSAEFIPPERTEVRSTTELRSCFFTAANLRRQSEALTTVLARGDPVSPGAIRAIPSRRLPEPGVEIDLRTPAELLAHP